MSKKLTDTVPDKLYYLFKKLCGKISFSCVRQYSNHCFTLAELFGESDRRRNICTAADTAHYSFLYCKVFSSSESFFI